MCETTEITAYKKRTVDEFKGEVLRLADEFYKEHGKWPNELHIGSLWLDAFDEIYNSYEKNSVKHDGPNKIVKHWWYMEMRCFREHWTHSVEWTEESEKIKILRGSCGICRFWTKVNNEYNNKS